MLAVMVAGQGRGKGNGNSRKGEGSGPRRGRGPADYFLPVILAQVSRRVTMRLKTRLPGLLSLLSGQK